MLTPKIARLLSMVAAAVVLPLLGLYALMLMVVRPTADGGMEPTVSMVSYIAFTLVFAVLIIIAVNFSLQLSRESKGKRETP